MQSGTYTQHTCKNIPGDNAMPARDRCYRTLILLLAVAATRELAAQTPRELAAARSWLVESELATSGIKSPHVLAAIREVPRHEFVPEEFRQYAYFDTTIPIGHGQTISPPYIVAWMTEQLDPQPGERVLEIGTGSGYQAAVLSRLAKDVYTIEIQPELAKRAAAALQRVKYKNVHTRHGDGFQGWAEAAPFDKIMVTCSPENVPAPLAEQLREGGRMLIPIGEGFQQNLCVLVKEGGKLRVAARTPTYFVPMTGMADALRSQPSDEPITPLVNGNFEELISPGVPVAWFYLRQAQLAPRAEPNQPGQCLLFTNAVPGRSSQAMQSIGVRGDRVRLLSVQSWVACKGVQPADAANPRDGAKIFVTFFDADRKTLDEQIVGLWREDTAWRKHVGVVKVPPTTIGMTVAIGLFGATGEFRCDDVVVLPAREQDWSRLSTVRR
jgi:protein-L-isoaspartate(D-aspartate) O-methyltransferase